MPGYDNDRQGTMQQEEVMKKSLQWLSRLGVLAVLTVAWLGVQPAAAQSPSVLFEVARLVVCSDVQNRAPVDVRDVFAAETGTVFCFLEARAVQETTEVTMVWYHEEEELASVPLTIGQSPRWRTYSSKEIQGRRGNWKVYLLDHTDNTLASVQFVIE
jgi:hypothetical protein